RFSGHESWCPQPFDELRKFPPVHNGLSGGEHSYGAPDPWNTVVAPNTRLEFDAGFNYGAMFPTTGRAAYSWLVSRRSALCQSLFSVVTRRSKPMCCLPTKTMYAVLLTIADSACAVTSGSIS